MKEMKKVKTTVKKGKVVFSYDSHDGVGYDGCGVHTHK